MPRKVNKKGSPKRKQRKTSPKRRGRPRKTSRRRLNPPPGPEGGPGKPRRQSAIERERKAEEGEYIQINTEPQNRISGEVLNRSLVSQFQDPRDVLSLMRAGPGTFRYYVEQLPDYYPIMQRINPDLPNIKWTDNLHENYLLFNRAILNSVFMDRDPYRYLTQEQDFHPSVGREERIRRFVNYKSLRDEGFPDSYSLDRSILPRSEVKSMITNSEISVFRRYIEIPIDPIMREPERKEVTERYFLIVGITSVDEYVDEYGTEDAEFMITVKVFGSEIPKKIKYGVLWGKTSVYITSVVEIDPEKDTVVLFDDMVEWPWSGANLPDGLNPKESMLDVYYITNDSNIVAFLVRNSYADNGKRVRMIKEERHPEISRSRYEVYNGQELKNLSREDFDNVGASLHYNPDFVYLFVKIKKRVSLLDASGNVIS